MKHLPHYWLFVRGIHRSSVDSPYKDKWHGALMFSLICAWINGWATNGAVDDLGRHRAHYDGTVMLPFETWRYAVKVINGGVISILAAHINSGEQAIACALAKPMHLFWTPKPASMLNTADELRLPVLCLSENVIYCAIIMPNGFS